MLARIREDIKAVKAKDPAARGRLVSRHEFIQSTSRKVNCRDNAAAESFFRTLKTELIYHVDLADEDHARQVLFEYIESFYNSRRLHATLDYVSPFEYELSAMAKCA